MKILGKFNSKFRAIESFEKRVKIGDNEGEKKIKNPLLEVNQRENVRFSTPQREYFVDNPWRYLDKDIWDRVSPQALDQESKVKIHQEPFNPTFTSTPHIIQKTQVKVAPLSKTTMDSRDVFSDNFRYTSLPNTMAQPMVPQPQGGHGTNPFKQDYGQPLVYKKDGRENLEGKNIQTPATQPTPTEP